MLGFLCTADRSIDRIPLFFHRCSTATSIQRHRNERRPFMVNYPVMNALSVVCKRRLKQTHHSRQRQSRKSSRWRLDSAYCEKNYRWVQAVGRTKYCFENVLPHFLSRMVVVTLRSFLQLQTEFHESTSYLPNNMHLVRARIGVAPLLSLL